ncbi:uncharacterized protein LOC124913108 [Impatiens glandulifera]|uniref:uncharacterized protein LOC124913108 n=1 Tax=Impatiens glandulifera TaxID=253017 RepID=UPI001FB0D8F4|nr:uncharacterized protein LOC124913108 [Impatiens glandulifera]
MRPEEIIKEFGDRFTNILNELSLFGKTYDNKETIVKSLRVLPSAWDVKTMVMRESRGFHNMKLHDVFEDLKSYEFEMNSRNEDEALPSTTTRALVTSVEPIALVPIKTTEQFSDDAMAMLTRKFGKFMKKNQPNNSYKYNYSNGNKANIRCFNCDALGHYRSECRKPRRDDRKSTDQNQREDHQSNNQNKEIQKAFLEDDSESKWTQSDSDSYDEGIRCLMANEKEVFDFASKEFTQEDLITTLNDMVIEYRNLSNLLPTQLNNQTSRTIELSSKNEKLKETIQLLTEENERKQYLIAAWTKSRDYVRQMNSHQRPPNYKFILGYDNRSLDKPCKELKLSKDKLPFITFVKSTSTNSEACHDSIKPTKELKYVGPTDKSR